MPIPKVIKELEDYPDIIDLLYAYYEFSQYVWERLCDYNAPETSDIRTAISNVRGEIVYFLKGKLWEKFLMQEVLDVDVDEHTDWASFSALLRALLEAETRIKQLIEERAEHEEIN